MDWLPTWLDAVQPRGELTILLYLDDLEDKKTGKGQVTQGKGQGQVTQGKVRIHKLYYRSDTGFCIAQRMTDQDEFKSQGGKCTLTAQDVMAITRPLLPRVIYVIARMSGPAGTLKDVPTPPGANTFRRSNVKDAIGFHT